MTEADSFLTRHPGADFQLPSGLRLHYLDEGRGEPVLMLHGNPTWSYMFRGLAEALSPDYRVIVPDHIGCGLSEKPGDDRYQYTLNQRVDDLVALLDGLGIGDGVTLIAHDWGGLMGMTLAARRPERFKRIVLMNTAAFLLPESRGFPWQLALARVPGLGALLVRGLNLFCKVSARKCPARPLSPEVRRMYLHPYGSWDDRIAVHRFVQDVPLRPGDRTYDLVCATRDALPRFEKTPMLICWGERDFIFDDHFLNEWVRRTPFARFHRIPQAGHYLMEDAEQEVVEVVRGFLAEHP